MRKLLDKLFIYGPSIGKNKPWLKKTFLWQAIVCHIYTRIRGLSGNLTFSKDARAYFKQNAERVRQVANLFFDEKSKNIFSNMITYRQTGKKSNRICNGEHTQYFINDFFKYSKNEVLIDCGAFTDDTIEKFLKLPNMEYEQIVAFEPDAENFRILENKFLGRGDNRFVLINAGAYNEDCELYFTGHNVSGRVSKISKGIEGETRINAKAIDNLPGLKKVTFIKMDIEGAEMDALEGAKETILRDKPRLAISIYHSNEDMLRIAEWIHKLVPQYKLYCRHHGEYPDPNETVLYAQITEKLTAPKS